jgi:hypothetical protein
MALFNTIRPWRFLFFFALAALAATTCMRPDSYGPAPTLSAEERYFVEQYLRLVEARDLAARGDSFTEGRFLALQQDLLADSLRAIAGRLSKDHPERWPLVFEEIVRRKEIMETERP